MYTSQHLTLTVIACTLVRRSETETPLVLPFEIILIILITNREFVSF